VDFNLPQRFKMEYTAADGTRKQPVMLHRALLGSLERFFGILVEHYAGAFPAWLAPLQARVLTITGDADAYAEQVVAKLRAAGLRAEADTSSDKINAKVRQGQVDKIPYSLVVGKKEAESGQVALRRRASMENQVMSLDEFIALALGEVASKR
jgi:threonyl-tRNA synthetase